MEEIAPFGYVRVVADEGAAILPVLKRVAATVRADGYAGPIKRPVLSETLITAHSFAKAHGGLAIGLNGRKQKPLKLSKRQTQILALRMQDMNNAQIAEALDISVSTVKTHLYYAYQKLEARNAIDAILRARELGLIEWE